MSTTWSYRILIHPDGNMAVHEVYYSDARADGWAEEPVTLGPYVAVSEMDWELRQFGRALEEAPLRIVGEELVRVDE